LAGKTDSFPASHKDSLSAILFSIEGIYSSSLQQSRFIKISDSIFGKPKNLMMRYEIENVL